MNVVSVLNCYTIRMRALYFEVPQLWYKRGLVSTSGDHNINDSVGWFVHRVGLVSEDGAAGHVISVFLFIACPSPLIIGSASGDTGQATMGNEPPELERLLKLDGYLHPQKGELIRR